MEALDSNDRNSITMEARKAGKMSMVLLVAATNTSEREFLHSDNDCPFDRDCCGNHDGYVQGY